MIKQVKRLINTTIDLCVGDIIWTLSTVVMLVFVAALVAGIVQ